MSQHINSKSEELSKALAQKTGVNEKDVTKVLEHLGLSKSLQRREAGLTGVSLDSLRIMSGPVMQ